MDSVGGESNCGGYLKDPQEQAWASWGEIRPLLESAATEVADIDNGFQDRVVGVVNDLLRARQRELYGDLATQLGDTATCATPPSGSPAPRR